MRSSIRRDLSLRIGLVIFCVSLLIGMAFYGFSVHFGKKKFNEDINNQTKKLSDTFTLQLWLFDLATTKELCKLMLDSPDISAIRLLNHKKEVIFEKGIFEDPFAIQISNELIFEDNTVGYLDVLYTDTIRKKQQDNIFIVGICLVVGAIISSLLLINYLLKRHLSKPLDKLQADMRAMAEGEYIESGLIKQKREIQSIIDSFNNMAVSLRKRDSERQKAENKLKRYRDQLEELVAERTKELNKANKSLHKAMKKAETANMAKSIFLANMSHELRTPLNAILGFSGIMKKSSEIPNSQQEHLDIINRSGEHLLRLINDVLEIVKIEAGRINLQEETFDLGALIRDVTDMMRQRAQEKNLDLLLGQSSDFPRYIYADPAKIRQILINLINNAVKFTETGGITLFLNADYDENSDNIRLICRVEDTGIGIEEENLEKIFTPFEQADKHSDIKGTGLGLAITRQYIEIMGGKIYVESEPGKGSAFHFELLAKKALKENIKAAIPLDNLIIGLAPEQPEYRILIVEDQLENRLLLKKILEPLGFPVKEALNGEQAIEIFRKWHPHLIWMDRRMPVMDGITATKLIREDERGIDTIIIALTASAFREQKEEVIEAGADDLIRKPFKESEIFDAMAVHLGVTYLYKEKDQNHKKTISENVWVLTSRDLSPFPGQVLKELNKAAMAGQSEKILELISVIEPEHERLAHSLKTLVAKYRFDKLVELTRV